MCDFCEIFLEFSGCIQSMSGLSHSFASLSNTCTCSTADNRKYVGFMIARFSSTWKMCWTVGASPLPPLFAHRLPVNFDAIVWNDCGSFLNAHFTRGKRPFCRILLIMERSTNAELASYKRITELTKRAERFAGKKTVFNYKTSESKENEKISNKRDPVSTAHGAQFSLSCWKKQFTLSHLFHSIFNLIFNFDDFFCNILFHFVSI